MRIEKLENALLLGVQCGPSASTMEEKALNRWQHIAGIKF